MATARLHASVAAPDGAVPAARGLAAWLTRIAPVGARGDLGIAVISDRRMRTLNRVYRGKDYATDVLAFVAGNQESGTLRPGSRRAGSRRHAARLLGEVVIAKGVAARQARAIGHPLRTELRVLALHGLLHLLGYDHDVDDGRMARVEARLRRKAGLPHALTERAR